MSEIQTQITIKDLVSLDTERIKIADKMKAEMEKEVKKSKAVVLKIDNLEESETASTRRTILNTLAKTLENKRLEFGRKINDFKKGWDSFFNNIKTPAEEEVQRINRLLSDYQAELRRKQNEEEAKRKAEIEKREKIQEAHAAKGHKIDETPRELLVPEVAPIKTQMAQKMRKVWKYEIIDESIIPRDYLCADTAKIYRAVTRKDNPEREIPGVKIYFDEVPC